MKENKAEINSEPSSFKLSEESIRIYSETRKDLLSRQLSNSEAYDRAILSLSSAMLGISLAFIKELIRLDIACNKGFLYFSWYLFSAAIVVTLISFIMSNLGVKRQLLYAQRYYLEGKREYLEKNNLFAKLTDFVNILSGICFILAIIFTVIFVTHNI